MSAAREWCIPQDRRSHVLSVILCIQEESNCSVYSKILKAIGVLGSIHTQSDSLIRIHFSLLLLFFFFFLYIHTDLKNIKEVSEYLNLCWLVK